MPEWHLDIVRDGKRNLLVVYEPVSGLLEREPIGMAVRLEIVRALRSIMLRTRPHLPGTIVTDRALGWFGVADATGVKHRILTASQPTALERIARQLIDNLDKEPGQ